MTRKKKGIVFLAAGLLLVGSLAIYSSYIANIDSPPKEEKVISEINSAMEEADASEIQDFLLVDQRHGVAPFQSNEGQYGMSYWKWSITGWKVVGVRTQGEPRMWKLDENDPSSFHIVWNINPEDQLQKLDYFYIRDRGYFGNETKERYYPSILMKTVVSLKDKPYGIMKLPKEWVQVMKADTSGSQRPLNMLMDEFNPGLYASFGWIPLNENGKDAEFNLPLNGSSNYNGDIHDEYMKRLSREDLEQSFSDT